MGPKKSLEKNDMTREEERAWQALARAAKRVREIQERKRRDSKPNQPRRPRKAVPA